MPDFVVNSLPAAVIALIGLLLGVIAYRRFNTKQLGEIQEKVIDAYKSQSEAQDRQIKMLKEKVQRLESIFSTLQITLKKRRGLLIEINDDLITLVDQRTGTEQTVQIHIDNGELPTIEKKEQ